MKVKMIAVFAAGMVFEAMLSRNLGQSSPSSRVCPEPASATAARHAASAPRLASAVALPKARAPERVVQTAVEAPPTPDSENVDDQGCPANASEYHLTHPSEDRLSCRCYSRESTTGPVWGTGVYTADSSICGAARHVGLWRNDGDEVTIYFKPGQSHYEGSEGNGIRSEDYGRWESSFSF